MPLRCVSIGSSIAQVIACQPDEPRFIGDQDVFLLQDKVIDHIVKAERETAAKAAAPTVVDPIQQTVTEEIKNAIRRATVNRDAAKAEPSSTWRSPCRDSPSHG